MQEKWVWFLGLEDPLQAWQPTSVFLPGESHGQGSLVGYSPRGHKESDITEATKHACTKRNSYPPPSRVVSVETQREDTPATYVDPHPSHLPVAPVTIKSQEDFYPTWLQVTRQKSSLSPFIFSTVLDIIASAVKEESKIQYMEIGKKKFKLSFFTKS